MRLNPAWQPALFGSFGCFHEKPDEASLQMALHTLSLGWVLPATTILKVQDCFFPTSNPKSAKLVSHPIYGCKAVHVPNPVAHMGFSSCSGRSICCNVTPPCLFRYGLLRQDI